MKLGGSGQDQGENAEAAGQEGGDPRKGDLSVSAEAKRLLAKRRMCRTGETSGPTPRGFHGRGPRFTVHVQHPLPRGGRGQPRAFWLRPFAPRLPTRFLAKAGQLDVHQRGCPFCQPRGLAARTQAVGVGAPVLQETIEPASPPGAPASVQRGGKQAPPP